MNYYLVTTNNLTFNLIKTEKDLGEDEINRIMGEKLNLPSEHPVFWVHTMWWSENPVIEI